MEAKIRTVPSLVTAHILGWARGDNGRSYGGGLVDYSTADIVTAYEACPPDHVCARAALMQEMILRRDH